jgi:hypothetical protein
MKNILQKLSTFFQKTNPRKKSKGYKTKAQSLVEVAIAFPLLIMLFSGMVEFGFMLNTYLSLLDATRQTARFYSNGQPFILDNSTTPATVTDDMTFYDGAAQRLIDTLKPPGDPRARSITFNPAVDDIIISVLSVSVSDSSHAITAINRFPTGLPNPYYQKWGNHVSAYADDTQIENLMTKDGTQPVRTGMLIVELYYDYTGVLQLPWVEAFMSSITLHADTIMPLVSAKPLHTP